MTKQTVYIATIDTRHGTNVLAGRDEDSIKLEIANYVEEWWEENMPEDHDRPENAGLMIEEYFDNTNEYLEQFKTEI